MKDKASKALFITHDAGFYGASRSLQALLRNYSGVHIDLLIPRRIFGGYKIGDVRKRFGGRIHSIFKVFLSLDYCYRGKPDRPVLLFLYKLLSDVLWHLSKRRLMKIIQNGGYDFIHLNSLTLNRLITPDYPFIIHVREIFDGSSPSAVASLKRAKGVIFIDDVSKNAVGDAVLQRSIVLNNPIDMTPLSEYALPGPDAERLAPDRNAIFAVIGKITADKGIDFIIRSFMNLKNDNARLVIVGSAVGDAPTFAKYKRLARPDPRIMFWGEEPEIEKIYRMSDYILRGEPYPCIGRTMYEGLYAGCHVIIPGDGRQTARIFEYELFKYRIHIYGPRNARELESLFETLSRQKVGDRVYRSNVDAYVNAFHAFVMSAARS